MPNGRFEGFNPGQLANRKELDGRVTGTVDANFAIRDVTAPITPDAITADGRATLTQSDGRRACASTSAEVDGQVRGAGRRYDDVQH